MVHPTYRKQLTVNYPDLVYPDDFTGGQRGKPARLAAEICRLNADRHDIFVQFGVPGIEHTDVVPHGLLFAYVKDREISDSPRDVYGVHVQVADGMLEGASSEIRTVDFTGRWLFALGVYYDRVGNAENAWKLFGRALEIDKGSIDMRLRLATALANAKRYKEALKYLADALEIDSKNPDCLKLGQSIINAIGEQEAVARND
jgi:hypothetical protein